MASLLFKEMKGLNFSCTSPASTAAICATIDGRSLISSGAGPAIDRYNPHLRDPRRSKPVKAPAPLLPQLPPSSKTKKKKKTSKSSHEKPNSSNFVSIRNNTSSSPGSSTRFLLNSDVTFSDHHHHHVFAQPEFLSVSSLDKQHEPSSSSSSSSPSSSSPSSSIANTTTTTTTTTSTSAATTVTAFTVTDASADDSTVVKPQDQVVVLRVSLHCKGCEGKVRKHISKMPGVKSFCIDFAAKKVTVIGDVTPLGVLNSISKVKSAQFWPSPGDSSS